MMSFRPHAESRKGRRLLGAALLVFFVNFFFPPLLPTVAYYIASPIWWIERNVPQSDRKIVLSEQSLVDENYSLRSQIADLNQKLVTFKTLEDENSDLRGVAKPQAGKGILAAVLAKPDVSPYDTIVIDVGTAEGVAAGDYVASGGGAVIGRVTAAENSFSKAILLSSPGLQTNVAVGPEHIQATAYGEGGGSLFIRLPRQYTVHDGDSIIVPELGNSPLGSVVLVNDDPSSSFIKILFSLPSNIYTLRFVTVEKNQLK